MSGPTSYPNPFSKIDLIVTTRKDKIIDEFFWVQNEFLMDKHLKLSAKMNFSRQIIIISGQDSVWLVIFNFLLTKVRFDW